MKVSVAIAAFNEGPDLEATIALLAAARRVPDEVVVIDDASERSLGHRAPVLKRLGPSRNWLKCEANPSRQGAGPTKHRAVEMCDGDVIVVMDSHMRPCPEWLDWLLEDIESDPLAVFCTRTASFNTWSGFDGRGARFVWDDKAGWWVPQWRDGQECTETVRVPCLIGGCYAATRKGLNMVGGYAPLLVGYGCEEEWLALRAWIVGNHCRVSMRSVVAHRFDRGLNHRARRQDGYPGWSMHYNRHIMASVLCSSAAYPAFAARIGFPGDVRSSLLSRQAEIGRFAKWLRSKKVRSSKYLTKLGVDLDGPPKE